MRVTGIPDEHLERIHLNQGNGKGTLGYKHIPSGITVCRDTNDLPAAQIDQELLVELEMKLRTHGVIPA